MNVFTETDYRKILKTAVSERKKIAPKCNFQHLADAMRVQKSYLSRVVNGSANLSPDQLFLVCEYFEFDEKQRDYVFLLLEYARCGSKKYREAVLGKIRRIQARYLETKEHLKAKSVTGNSSGSETYYLDPLHQIVHIALSIARYQSDLALLAHDLRIPVERLLSAVQKLEQLGIISREKNGAIKTLVKNVHLPRTSPVYTSWRNQLKLISMQQLQNLGPSDSYSFAVVFSADIATRRLIQSRFLEFLKEVEEMVGKASNKNVFQLNFDLFNWTQPGRDES